MSDDNYLIPQRRKNRLACIQYNETGAYFITICTRDRVNLFWKDSTLYIPRNPDVGAPMRRPPDHLSLCGQYAAKYVEAIDQVYQGIITVDNYVIMPNHVHLLLAIHPENVGGRRIGAPTISSVINQYKGRVSKEAGFPCWQKSFHDHVVRNEAEYRKIWEYIDNNPAKWAEDRYHIPPGD